MTNSRKPYNLDTIFEALANQHRRNIVYVIGLQPHSISQLASMQNLSLQAIHKHIRILEEADLISRKKTGRVTYLALKRESLRVLQEWLNQYHTYWGTENESFENYTNYLQREKKGGENK